MVSSNRCCIHKHEQYVTRSHMIPFIIFYTIIIVPFNILRMSHYISRKCALLQCLYPLPMLRRIRDNQASSHQQLFSREKNIFQRQLYKCTTQLKHSFLSRKIRSDMCQWRQRINTKTTKLEKSICHKTLPIPLAALVPFLNGTNPGSRSDKLTSPRQTKKWCCCTCFQCCSQQWCKAFQQ